MRGQPEPSSTGCQGGLVRTAALIESTHVANQTLLLDLGDAAWGTLWYTVYHSNMTVESMSSLEYSAVALGSRDLHAGTAALADLMTRSAAPFPWVSSNMDVSGDAFLRPLANATGDDPPLLKPFEIVRVGQSFRVGVVSISAEVPWQLPCRPAALPP